MRELTGEKTWVLTDVVASIVQEICRRPTPSHSICTHAVLKKHAVLKRGEVDKDGCWQHLNLS